MSAFVESVRAFRLGGALRQPFTIATGSHTKVENVLVRVALSDGTLGWGECAPAPHITGETQASTLASVRRLAPLALGRLAAAGGGLARELEEAAPRSPCARAGLEMALLDAALRRVRAPLYRFLGGAGALVRTDATIPLGPLERAPVEARRWVRRGIRTLKVKIGRDAEEDVRRVLAIASAAPRAALILDANQGYREREALRVWRDLARKGVRPGLFEQPLPKADLGGLAALTRRGLPVCADESVGTRDEARRAVRARACRVVNLKLMKSGFWQALEIAWIARRAGLGLMIGGMMESSLAMGCAAHVASALAVRWVDLDTPLFFARDPVRGLRLKRDGTYDLAGVRAGIGAVPITRWAIA